MTNAVSAAHSIQDAPYNTAQQTTTTVDITNVTGVTLSTKLVPV